VWRWVAHILRQIFHLDVLTVGDYTRTSIAGSSSRTFPATTRGGDPVQRPWRETDDGSLEGLPSPLLEPAAHRRYARPGDQLVGLSAHLRGHRCVGCQKTQSWRKHRRRVLTKATTGERPVQNRMLTQQSASTALTNMKRRQLREMRGCLDPPTSPLREPTWLGQACFRCSQMQNQRPIRASLPAITRENQLRLDKLMKTKERVWRRGWDLNLRALNTPVFDDSDRRKMGENEGLGTVRNLDSVNGLFSVTYGGGEGGMRTQLMPLISTI
jgi:hypothetical protein